MPSMLLSREAVSEADRPGAQDRAQRQRAAMDRVCAINNANVTRDYGTHTADFSRPVRALAADELTDVLNLVMAVYAPPVRLRPPAPARPFDRRRSAPTHMPDLPPVTGYTPPEPPDSSYASGGGGGGDFGGGGASGSWD